MTSIEPYAKTSIEPYAKRKRKKNKRERKIKPNGSRKHKSWVVILNTSSATLSRMCRFSGLRTMQLTCYTVSEINEPAKCSIFRGKNSAKSDRALLFNHERALATASTHCTWICSHLHKINRITFD